MGGPGTANNHRPEPLMLHLTVLHDVIIIIIIIMIVIIIIMSQLSNVVYTQIGSKRKT